MLYCFKTSDQNDLCSRSRNLHYFDRMKHFLIALTLALLSPLASAEPLNIFVSVLPQQTFVEKIGGEHVSVQAMVTPGSSPATYNPTPQQISALSQADAYIRIGVPFEKSWMKRIRSANPDMLVIDARKNIDLRSLEAHGHDHHHHDHAEELDPHIWTSPVVVLQIAKTIRDELTKLSPQHQNEFENNFISFEKELTDLHQELSTIFKPKHGMKFLVFHPSWGYFADTYHLEQLTIEKEGKQPGAKALAAIIEQAKREKVDTVFVQPQFDQKMAQQIAKAINGKVIAIDPLSKDYSKNLMSVAQQMTRTKAQ